MSARKSLLTFLCSSLLLSLAVGCGGASTPEAAFQNMKKAAQDKNWRAYCNCLTEESQDTMAGMMVLSGSMMQALGGLAGNQNQVGEKIKGVFEKHGLSADAVEKLKNEGPPMSMDKGLSSLSSAIKDRAGFLADMMEVMSEFGDAKKVTPVMDDATLTDVKIEGDTATGTVTAGGRSGPMHFKRVGSQWKIDLTGMMGQR
jgi:hypothetical protein